MTDRPLTARSVLASTLLGTDPPELPVSSLLRVAALFAINENRARVALSRMVAAGEAATVGAARYRLAGPLLERRERQLASRAGTTRAWSGRWTVVVAVEAAASAEARSRRRRELASARLAELREGVWVRPDNVDVDTPEGALRMDGALPVDTDERALASRLWDLDRWAGDARALGERLEATAPETPEALAPGFVLSASVLRHLQADPLLPAPLLPPGWPGPDLRATYDAWDRRYRRLLARWVREVT